MSAGVAASLNLLYAFAGLALAASLPYFAPENIFQATSSRLQTPTDTLFARVAKLRAPDPRDEALRAKFASLEARLLYLVYGACVVAECPFCSADEPSSYFYYALPALLSPHLLHLAVLGLATSTVEGARWRTGAAIVGVALAALDVWSVGTYDYRRNAAALRLDDLEPFYWRIRMLRCLAFALVDGLLGYALYLSSTHRWLALPPTPAERIEENTRIIESLRSKLYILGAMKNTVARDNSLRERSAAHWLDDSRCMREVYEDEEVMDGVQGALDRVDVELLERQAGSVADSVVGVMESMRRSTTGQA